MKPLVSIVIPVFNGADYLRDAIDSALAQTYDNIEVLVVNDGSNDDGATERIALSYDGQIKYFSKENGGVATALNLGIEKMRGEYFSWLSHDDVYFPQKTEKQIAFYRGNEASTTILYSNYELMNKDGDLIRTIRHDHALLAKKPLYAVLLGAIHGCSMMIPKKCFEQQGVFNEKLKTTQDYDLWFNFVRHYKFVHMEEVLIRSRNHEKQGSLLIPTHDSERNDLWYKIFSGLTDEDIFSCEDSKEDFYVRVSEYLERTPYKKARDYVARQKRKHLISRYGGLPRHEARYSVVYSSEALPSAENRHIGSFLVSRIRELLCSGINVLLFKEEECRGPQSVRYSLPWLKKFLAGYFYPLVQEDKVSASDNLELTRIVLLLPFWWKYLPASLRKCFLKGIRRKKDVALFHVHFLWYAHQALDASDQFGLPLVVTAHGSDVHQTMATSPEARDAYIEIMNRSAGVIFVSEKLRRMAMSMGAPSEKTIVVGNGYDPSIFFPVEKKKSTHSKVVGYVGNLYWVKRADRLPQIFHEIKRRSGDIRFVIVGGGNPELSLQDQLIKDLSSLGLLSETEMPGAVSQEKVAEYFRATDVLILPSRNEGFGCVALEAQACGVPVVGSANGGIPEVVFSGAVVEEGDDFEMRFVEAVLDVLSKDWDPFEVAAKVSHLTWQNTVEREVAFYDKIINGEMR